VQSTEAFVAFRKAKGHKQVGFFKVQSTEAFIAKSVYHFQFSIINGEYNPRTTFCPV
jgi:hypothetical protein